MHTRFEDRPPMRAALAYYLNYDARPSRKGIEAGNPNAILWPSGTGGGYIEMPQHDLSESNEWVVVLGLHQSTLGVYKVTKCFERNNETEEDEEVWLVYEFDHLGEYGKKVDPEDVENFSSSGVS